MLIIRTKSTPGFLAFTFFALLLIDLIIVLSLSIFLPFDFLKDNLFNL